MPTTTTGSNTLIRALVILAALAMVYGVPGQAEDPVVFQLDQENLSTSELDRLAADLSVLQRILADTTLGPQRKHGEDGWTHYSFSLFSGGSLAERGYPVFLAQDGQLVWVLVGLAVGGRTVWVPVEPTPTRGTTQLTLGSIPFVDPASRSMQLQARYLTFSSASPLPKNASPVARFRASGRIAREGGKVAATVGQRLQLDASPSSDPDGGIALYRWYVGTSSCVASPDPTHSTRSDQPGTTPITLVVVDHAGRSASISAVIDASVASPQQRDDKDSGGDCGCG